VILFQIHAPHITLDPFEGDAPGTIDRDRVAFGFPVQRMKPKAGDAQILKATRLVKCMQNAQRPFLVVWPNPRTGAGLEQVTQALVAEALEHRTNCSA